MRTLRQEGVHRINRAIVTPGPPGGAPWVVRIARRLLARRVHASGSVASKTMSRS